MANIANITLKPDKNGRDYKNVKLDENVHGKQYFNIFPRHARYNDVVQGRSFSSEEFVLKGQFLEMIDPNQGIKKGYNAPQPAANTEKLDQVLSGQMILTSKVDQILKWIASQPPF